MICFSINVIFSEYFNIFENTIFEKKIQSTIVKVTIQSPKKLLTTIRHLVAKYSNLGHFSKISKKNEKIHIDLEKLINLFETKKKNKLPGFLLANHFFLPIFY